jgi:outer membrane protein TolC
MKKSLLLGALLVGGTLFAETLSLQDAVKKAVKNNLEIKAEKLKAKESYYDYKAAKGYLFPQLSLSYFFSRTNQPPYSIMFKMNTHSLQFPRVMPSFNPNDPNTITAPAVFGWTAQSFKAMEDYFNNPGSAQLYDLQLKVQVPIWMGGKVRNMIKGKYFQWRSQEFLADRKTEEVAFQVADTYMKALYAKAAVEAAKTALKTMETTLKVVEKMHQSGLALYSDVLRAKVYLESVKQKYTEAENNLYIAKKALLLLMNEKGDPQELTLEGELYCPAPAEVEKEVKALKEAAAESRKDLRALREGITAVQYYRKATLGTYLPDFVAFGQYDMYDNYRVLNFKANSYMVGIGLQWKIFDGLSAFNQLQKLKTKERELKTTLEYALKGVDFQIDKAYRDYLTAYAGLKRAETQIAQAEESFKIVKARYQHGLATIVDLLSVQSQLDMARFQKVEALYKCNRAYLELYNSAGKLWEVLK